MENEDVTTTTTEPTTTVDEIESADDFGQSSSSGQQPWAIGVHFTVAFLNSVLLPFFYWVISYYWNLDYSRDAYFAWNTKYYTFWIMGMITHAVVFGPETLLAITTLFDIEIMNTMYLYACEISMAGPFGLYWTLFAFLIWAYKEPATDAFAEVPEDEMWWNDAVKNTLITYIFVEAGFAFLQIWTMPAIRDWVEDKNNQLSDVGGRNGDVLRDNSLDYNSGDYIM